jgi:hypothetical protein
LLLYLNHQRTWGFRDHAAHGHDVLRTTLAERVIPDPVIRFDNALDGSLQTVYVFGFEHTLEH